MSDTFAPGEKIFIDGKVRTIERISGEPRNPIAHYAGPFEPTPKSVKMPRESRMNTFTYLSTALYRGLAHMVTEGTEA